MCDLFSKKWSWFDISPNASCVIKVEGALLQGEYPLMGEDGVSLDIL